LSQKRIMALGKDRVMFLYVKDNILYKKIVDYSDSGVIREKIGENFSKFGFVKENMIITNEEVNGDRNIHILKKYEGRWNKYLIYSDNSLYLSPASVDLLEDTLYIVFEILKRGNLPFGLRRKILFGKGDTLNPGFEFDTVFAENIPLSSIDTTIFTPSLRVDPFGNVHIVFTGINGDIFYLTNESGIWEEPLNISQSPDVISKNPFLNVFDSKIFVLWEEGDEIYMRKKLTGGEFGVVDNISESTGIPSFHPFMIRGSLILYVEREGNIYNLKFLKYDGREWTGPFALYSSDKFISYPQVDVFNVIRDDYSIFTIFSGQDNYAGEILYPVFMIDTLMELPPYLVSYTELALAYPNQEKVVKKGNRFYAVYTHNGEIYMSYSFDGLNFVQDTFIIKGKYPDIGSDGNNIYVCLAEKRKFIRDTFQIQQYSREGRIILWKEKDNFSPYIIYRKPISFSDSLIITPPDMEIEGDTIYVGFSEVLFRYNNGVYEPGTLKVKILKLYLNNFSVRKIKNIKKKVIKIRDKIIYPSLALHKGYNGKRYIYLTFGWLDSLFIYFQEDNKEDTVFIDNKVIGIPDCEVRLNYADVVYKKEYRGLTGQKKEIKWKRKAIGGIFWDTEIVDVIVESPPPLSLKFSENNKNNNTIFQAGGNFYAPVIGRNGEVIYSINTGAQNKIRRAYLNVNQWIKKDIIEIQGSYNPYVNTCPLDSFLVFLYVKKSSGKYYVESHQIQDTIPFYITGFFNSPFKLKDRIYVTGDVIFRDSVEILPGTEIIFYDNDDQRRKDTPYDTTSKYKIGMEVFRYMKAEGSESDTVYFKGIRDEYMLWNSLYLSGNSGVDLKFCVFKNAYSGIYTNSKLGGKVEKSVFKKNMTGIALIGAENLEIRSSMFLYNGVFTGIREYRKVLELQYKKGLKPLLQRKRDLEKGGNVLIDSDSIDGGIWAANSSFKVYGSYFEGNKRDGIMVHNKTGKNYVEIRRSIFNSNYLSGVYAVLTGIFSDSINLRVDSSEFFNHLNEAGAGIYIITGTDFAPDSKGSIYIHANRFKDNREGIRTGCWIRNTYPSYFNFSVILYRNSFIKNNFAGLSMLPIHLDYRRGINYYLRGNIFSENNIGIYVRDNYSTYYVDAGRNLSATGFNSFMNNSFHIQNLRKDTFWAQNNIWSERDSLSIEERLIDDSDESFYGPVIFKPVAFSGIIKKDTTWTGDIVIGGDVIIEREAKLKVRKGDIKVFPYDALFSGIDTERVEIIVKGEFDMKKSNISVIDSTPFGFFGIRSVYGGGEISWLRKRSYRDELSRLGNRSYINDDGLSRLGNRSYGYDDNKNSKSRIHTAINEINEISRFGNRSYKDGYSGKEGEIKVKKSEIRDALYGLYIEGGEAEIKKSKVLNVKTGIYIKDGELEIKKTEVKSYDYSLFIDGFEEIELKNNKNSFLPYSGYAIYNNTPFDINAERNYFGTSDIDSVEKLIFHKPDDSTKGFVDYLPLWIPEGDEEISGIQSKDSEIKEELISVPVLQVNNLSLLIKGYKRTIIEIYRITGEKILLKKIEDKNKFIRFKTENLPAGVYFVKLKTENRKIKRKVIIIK